MPSFDIVSEFDAQELNNAVNQANREIGNRFDLKGTGCKVEQEKDDVVVHADEEFQLEQVKDIFRNQLIKRGIDVRAIEEQDAVVNLGNARQAITMKQGVDTVLAKKIVKMIKEKKMKVQASIQGEKVRVTGKKRDDLQSVIAFIKDQELDQPLQYDNFRD